MKAISNTSYLPLALFAKEAAPRPTAAPPGLALCLAAVFTPLAAAVPPVLPMLWLSARLSPTALLIVDTHRGV